MALITIPYRQTLLNTVQCQYRKYRFLLRMLVLQKKKKREQIIFTKIIIKKHKEIFLFETIQCSGPYDWIFDSGSVQYPMSDNRKSRPHWKKDVKKSPTAISEVFPHCERDHKKFRFFTIIRKRFLWFIIKERGISFITNFTNKMDRKHKMDRIPNDGICNIYYLSGVREGGRSRASGVRELPDGRLMGRTAAGIWNTQDQSASCLPAFYLRRVPHMPGTVPYCRN